ncbi:MAG TPA: aldo/keto reductase [Lysobacter sp.]|nr:aldo/keto reductase [Lysobacter sp.]
MNHRRDFLVRTGLAAGALLLSPLACARDTGARGPLAVRRIPSTGEALPVIGMGTSGSFEVGADDAQRAPLREVLEAFLAAGARVIDTSPNYGSAEDVLGDLLAERTARARIFLASKLAAEGRDAGLAQFERSLQRLRTDRLDLLQVHNLRDWRTQIEVARELKRAGKVRYIGLTHYRDDAHDALAEAMRASRPDFVQVNYSVVSRNAERRVLPLAQELGVAVIANRTFEDGRLFAQVRGKPLPAWAREVGADSWAQLFLKFALSHPAITVVIPATSKARNQRDNLGAGTGPMLDDAQRAALVAALEG